MSYSVAPLERLIEQLERLPGIGHKSAQRLAFFLLNQPEKNAADFVSAITEAGKDPRMRGLPEPDGSGFMPHLPGGQPRCLCHLRGGGSPGCHGL